ncbi:ABC transporter [Alteromonas sp. KUL42]|uniref:ABC transporter permease n=1 Tax=Alteromonas sp. KUL42 TaxID=2480797 RepID=UPI000792E007|nr:ABC transporter permease [Alteromonas sp. KUL42]KXJ58187.1 MAG: ABC transporter [Alteromonas sp. Nap_26]TAP37501.1 ABC transporter [Alteromonas sp. KUL42]
MMLFKDQLYAWRSVIFALFLRELQSKFNDKFGLGWAFLEPFAFILALSYLRGLVSGSDIHSIPIFIFMMIGMMGLQSFTNCLQTVSASVKRNKPLYAFRQVQPISAVITAGFLEFSIKVIVVLLLFVSVFLLDETFAIHNPLLLIFLFLSLWVFAISTGLLFAIATAFVPEVDKLKSMLTRPLMFISCVFYSLQDLPEKFWPYLTWNPLVHFIELARYACFESYGHNGVSLSFLIQATLALAFLSLCLYHITWRRVLSR